MEKREGERESVCVYVCVRDRPKSACHREIPFPHAHACDTTINQSTQPYIHIDVYLAGARSGPRTTPTRSRRRRGRRRAMGGRRRPDCLFGMCVCLLGCGRGGEGVRVKGKLGTVYVCVWERGEVK